MNLFTNWFKNPFRKAQKSSCKENGDCLKYLQLIMDKEATPDQEKHFYHHIEACMPCYKKYHLEKTIKQVIQSKCGKMEVPAELIESIKSKIKHSA